MRPELTKESGFTLLELMVATMIMGIAVAGLLASLGTCLRSSVRVREAEQIPFVARHEMDRLLAEPSLANFQQLSGDAGNGISWVAEATPFEYPPHPQAGMLILQRVELQLLWLSEGKRHKYQIEGFRQSLLSPADALRLHVTPEGSP